MRIPNICQSKLSRDKNGVTGIWNSGSGLLRMASSSVAESGCGGRNRLQYEKSPYLLQHQTNPVHWYPWSEEAFALAKRLDRPIFLSVGYSTCHWCHVMERESFENPAVAALMNSLFVNIKVDREERPDIDRIYMTFVQAMSGSGGWPMSVWMTPDLKPFYGGTYYPPDDRYFGRPGFKSLLQTIADQWVEKKEKCLASADKIVTVLHQSATLPWNERIPEGEEVALKCVQQLTRSYEPSFGGFSEQPKFPQPVNLLFLQNWTLQHPTDSKRASTLKMVETTLEEMAKGGIHDQVGQGFSRYSVDKKWHVPHFEKMLYDQAQLVIAYSNAYLLTSKPLYRDIVHDILTYVSRDLRHPEEGGFYAGEDADSLPKFDSTEKKEGAFYVWTADEIDELLGDRTLANGKVSQAQLVKQRFGIKATGNVDPYQDPHDELKLQNVLFEAKSLESMAQGVGIPVEEIRSALEEARIVLFNYRNINRPRPALDTKFVTSWNGLMIKGYAVAGMALQSQEYIQTAVAGMDFLKKYVINENFDLLRTCYKEGSTTGQVTNLEHPILGCVDDFANLVSASIQLFQATFNPDYLQLAIRLQEKQDDLFWDEEKGGYYNSRANVPSVLVRFKDDDDGAEPSSNSTSVLSLIHLHLLTEKKEYENKLEKLFRQFSDRLTKVPMTLPVMTAALAGWTNDPVVVFVSGKDLQASQELSRLRSRLNPICDLVVGLDSSQRSEPRSLLNELVPSTKSGSLQGASPTEVNFFVKTRALMLNKFDPFKE